MAIDLKDVSVSERADPDITGSEGPKPDSPKAEKGKLAPSKGAGVKSGKDRSKAGTAAKKLDPRSLWLYKPAIDLLIGCAGWTAPLLLVLYFASSASATVAVLFYSLALLFNYPHYTATIYRAYRTREDFSRYRLFTVHLTLLIALAGAVAHWSPWLIAWLFTIYITWSPWHYSGQNFGLAMMFARRAGIKPTRAERNALYTSFLASYGIVFLTMHSGVSLDPYVLSLGLPVAVGGIGRLALGVVFALTGPWALFRLARRGGWKLIVAPATLFATQSLWFVLPYVLQLVYGFEIPQTRYSTGILAVMHSAQYLWITSYYAKREALASGAKSWRVRPYFVSLIVGGIALFLPGPWLISYVFHYNFTSTVLIFTAIINIHHFLLDGAIWKLREGRIAALLISSPAKVTSSLWGMAGWVAGRTRPARAFRLAAVAVLVLLAAVDQTRFFLAANASDLSNLQRASRLNPYDAGVHASLGRARENMNDTDRAVAEFRQAVNLNPHNPEVRGTYFRLLLEQGRYDEAYDEYKRLAPYTRNDSDALLNFGILAQRLGRKDEAIQSWRRALSIAPGTKSAYLYLADALYSQGKHKEAIPHYEQYLAMLASDPDPTLDPRDVVGVALRVGDAYGAVKDYERAMVFYGKAGEIARKTGIKSLESVVLEHEGNLYAGVGRKTEAGELYKEALKLDAEGKDEKATALDWFAYAQFLNDTGKPKNLVLACALKAEELLTPTPGSELELVKKYRQTTEASVKAGAATEGLDKIRSNLKSLLDESLKLTF